MGNQKRWLEMFRLYTRVGFLESFGRQTGSNFWTFEGHPGSLEFHDVDILPRCLSFPEDNS